MYHVTSWRAINNIITDSIKLTEARDCLDFGQSPSFYLTPNADVAREYIFRVRKHTMNEAAVAIYAIPSLDSMKNLIRFSRPNKDWKTMIEYSRKCNKQNINREIESCAFIYGPMCKNPEAVKYSREYPKTHQPQKIQLAVKETGLSDIRLLGTIYCDKSEDIEEFEGGSDNDSDSAFLSYMDRPTKCTYDDLNAFFKTMGWKKLKRNGFSQEHYCSDWTVNHIFDSLALSFFKDAVDKYNCDFYLALRNCGVTVKKYKEFIKTAENDERLRSNDKNKLTDLFYDLLHDKLHDKRVQ